MILGVRKIDINFSNFNETVSGSDMIRQQLTLFLQTRAAHKNMREEIIEDGECEYDSDQGLDYSLIFDPANSAERVKNYMQTQIMQYFQGRISKIEHFVISKDTPSRTYIISFTYTVTWGNVESAVITIGG